MGKFKHYLFATASLAILVGALAILGPEYGQGAPPGPPGGLEVQVVNQPLAVTGTITTSPNVNAAQDGT